MTKTENSTTNNSKEEDNKIIESTLRQVDGYLDKFNKSKNKADKKKFLQQAQNLLDEIFQKDPENVSAICKLSAIYSLNDFQKAVQLLTNFLKKQPECVEIIVQLAEIYYLNKEFANAIDILMDLLEKQPNCAKAIAKLALVYYQKQNFKKAIDYYSQAIALTYDLESMYTERATCYLGQGKWQEAIEDYQAALKHSKEGQNNGLVYCNLGLSYLNIKNFKEALKFTNLAIKEKVIIAHINRIKIARFFRKYQEMITDCEVLIKNGLFTADTYTSITFACIELRSFTKALDLGKKGLDLFPRDVDIHYNVAMAYLNMESVTDAIVHLEICSKEDYNKKYNYLLGDLYLRTNNFEAARKKLTQIDKNDKNYPEARKLLKEIEQPLKSHAADKKPDTPENKNSKKNLSDNNISLNTSKELGAEEKNKNKKKNKKKKNVLDGFGKGVFSPPVGENADPNIKQPDEKKSVNELGEIDKDNYLQMEENLNQNQTDSNPILLLTYR